MTTTSIRRSAGRFVLGDPQIAGPLSVHPIFGPRGPLRYRGLHGAARRGARVTELGSVNQVHVSNPTDLPILLYEGELILGAAQNRVIDQSVLVPATSEIEVPVSCVEAGRWDVSQHGTDFAPSPDVLDPGMRAAKRASANRAAAARPDQGAVWREVSERLNAASISSPSEAFTDIFDARRADVEGVAGEIELIDRQIGTVALLNGWPLAIDLVSSRRVFTELHGRLVHGFALQALDAPRRRMPSADRLRSTADDFLSATLKATWQWIPNPGMGDAYKPTGGGVEGCSLRMGRGLVALSAFPTVGD